MGVDRASYTATASSPGYPHRGRQPALGPGHVRRGLTHGERTRKRQVLEYGTGRTGQLAPRPVPAVKRQVDGPEELREPFGLRSFLGHATRVAAWKRIVNPDGFRRRDTSRSAQVVKENH